MWRNAENWAYHHCSPWPASSSTSCIWTGRLLLLADHVPQEAGHWAAARLWELGLPPVHVVQPHLPASPRISTALCVPWHIKSSLELTSFCSQQKRRKENHADEKSCHLLILALSLFFFSSINWKEKVFGDTLYKTIYLRWENPDIKLHRSVK